jgi:thioglycine synthase
LFSKHPSHLERRIKCTTPADRISTRERSIQNTLTKVIPLATKIGVTRTSNITFMDRLYIPNYSAVLPGTEDTIWVYSGKGISGPHALASALMEAIERYSSLPSTYAGSFIQGSYSQVSKSHDNVLHPDEVIEPLDQKYDDKSLMDFMLGIDLLSEEEVLVPAGISLYRYSPKPPSVSPFLQYHTNGLASGNVKEEAICHALCEVIERDAVSIADLCTSSIPYSIIEKISISSENAGYPITRVAAENKFVDDGCIFPDVDISEISEECTPIGCLVKRFALAGVSLLIKDITQKDIGIPTFVASSTEWITHDYGYFAKGFGSHPDSRVALLRAITEVSQTRAVNIQGARDDLRKIQYKGDDGIHKRKWQFIPSSTSEKKDGTRELIKFSEIKSYVNNDILDDIDLIIRRLKEAELERAIIVDLTDPNVGIPVVRAIVPGLESFEVTHTIMGKRAKKYFGRIYSL